MFEGVVITAQQDQVPERGGAAIGPVDFVVDVTPSGWSVTTRVLAVTVTGNNGPCKPGGMVRLARPMSRGCPSGPNTTREIEQSQAKRRTRSGGENLAVDRFMGAAAVTAEGSDVGEDKEMWLLLSGRNPAIEHCPGQVN